jgi:hypothetical protein
VHRAVVTIALALIAVATVVILHAMCVFVRGIAVVVPVLAVSIGRALLVAIDVARIEIHSDLPCARRPLLRCDRFVADVRGFRCGAVAPDRQKPQ